MQKLLWVGSPFFARNMEACGWDLKFYNFEHTAVFGWEELTELADGPPDVLVVADKSRPPFVVGMENFPCLTVFYCVDSHIHSYYPYYAQGFDVCLVSLGDHIPRFQNMALPSERIIHVPAFAKDADLPPAPGLYADGGMEALLATWPERDWDMLFVGSVNSENTPLRKGFMQALAAETPNFQITRGNYRELYPRARLVFNHCELGDLNFRVFEALGCGCALLTPLVGHGFAEMFELEKDLFTYEMNDYADAAKRARELLGNPEACMTAARSGFLKVNSRHRAMHRAEALSSCLLELARRLPSVRQSCGENSLGHQRITRSRLARVREIRHNYLRFIYLLLAEKIDHPALKEAYLRAARE